MTVAKKLIKDEPKHRYTLDPSGDPVPFCWTEPFMNYQVAKDAPIVRTWDETTCGHCHHLLSLGKHPVDRHFRVIQ